jgi:hypothetical protein
MSDGLKAGVKLLIQSLQARHAQRSLLTAVRQRHLCELSTPPCLLHVPTGRHSGVLEALLQLCYGHWAFRHVKVCRARPSLALPRGHERLPACSQHCLHGTSTACDSPLTVTIVPCVSGAMSASIITSTCCSNRLHAVAELNFIML